MPRPAVPADRSQQDAAVSLEGFPHFALCHYLAPNSPDRQYSRCLHFANGSPGETQEGGSTPEIAQPDLTCYAISSRGLGLAHSEGQGPADTCRRPKS